MKFIVSLNYKNFGFETLEAAGQFACMAKNHSLDPTIEVKIEVFNELDEEDQDE